MQLVIEWMVIWRSLVRAGFGQALVYRGQVAIFLLTSLFPLVMMTVWLSVVDEVGPAAGWDRRGFISYYAVGAVVFQLTTSSIAWHWDELIRTGGLSALLLRPVSPLTQQVGLEVGKRLLSAALATGEASRACSRRSCALKRLKTKSTASRRNRTRRAGLATPTRRGRDRGPDEAGDVRLPFPDGAGRGDGELRAEHRVQQPGGGIDLIGLPAGAFDLH